MDSVGPLHPLSDFIHGVVIAADHKHTDVLLCKSAELSGRPEPGRHVRPATIEQIPGNQDKGNSFIYRQGNQVLERVTCCTTEAVDGCSFVRLQPAQGAVDVKVCAVNKPEIRHW